MTNDELKQLKALALSLNGWHWPDRKRDSETGVHYFGQWKEGEFYELGTIDGSTYTDDYADDIRLLKFFRAVQPSTILALIAKVESLEADAARYQWLRQEKADHYVAIRVSDDLVDTASYERLDAAIDQAMEQEKA